MAFHRKRGLFDPFGGQKDLTNRLIRAVGNPDVRFNEDALRILRAFRFAAKLGFAVEPHTFEAVRKNAFLVEKISGERIKSELDRILLSERPQQVLELIRTGALAFAGMIAEPKTVWPDNLPEGLPVRFAALFYLCRPADAGAVMDRLRFDTPTRNGVLRLLGELNREPPKNSVQSKKRLASGISSNMFADYLRLCYALTGCDTKDRLSELSAIIEKKEPFTLSMLAVNGEEIMNTGISKGPECGRILALLLDKVIENPNLNDKNMLLTLAKQAANRQ